MVAMRGIIKNAEKRCPSPYASSEVRASSCRSKGSSSSSSSM